MNSDRDQIRKDQQQPDQSGKKEKHLDPFKESNRSDEKSTTNIEEEVSREQERKEAMTERD